LFVKKKKKKTIIRGLYTYIYLYYNKKYRLPIYDIQSILPITNNIT